MPRLAQDPTHRLGDENAKVGADQTSSLRVVVEGFEGSACASGGRVGGCGREEGGRAAYEKGVGAVGGLAAQRALERTQGDAWR